MIYQIEAFVGCTLGLASFILILFEIAPRIRGMEKKRGEGE